MSEQTLKTAMGAVHIFDVRLAESPNDAAIEALVDQYIKFLIKQSKLKDIAFADLCCATIEAAARLSVATLVAAGVGVTPESERVIKNMVRYFEASMIARLSGRVPGHEDTIGEPEGHA